ncbi:hypothetical protein CLV47_1335 [Antricoccus suffuscus]|uniref:Copper(I)-binding protein n=1 Tax=Antricoccus suffuscus TaxID=1629062 RepID=A0A2T0YZG8_9ACTN|nr:copper chaperone PCu(A)C [Antricoccus suffuscus]PRZ29496.1 hypothetical protein CLV47_1335 [Antricoccus suffuscus]
MTSPTGTTRRGLPMRLVVPVFAIALGIFAFVKGFDSPPKPAAAPVVPASATRAGDIAVYGAYVREPASPQTAAAYLVITNVGSKTDTLSSVSSGASATAMLHDVNTSGSTTAAPSNAEQAEGAETMTATPNVPIKPGQTITLKPGAGHIMLEGLIGPIVPGQTVNLLLNFNRAGGVVVVAPVIAIGATPPKY